MTKSLWGKNKKKSAKWHILCVEQTQLLRKPFSSKEIGMKVCGLDLAITKGYLFGHEAKTLNLSLYSSIWDQMF